jgi:very-short-patch-repair endonuclease
MDVSPLDRIAQEQHGLVTFQQARDAGLTPRQWTRLHESGFLREVHPKVSSLFAYPESSVQRILAATFSIGGRPIASHRTALHLWGAWNPGENEPIDVIVDHRPGGRHLEGVVVHRPRDVKELAPVRLHNVPVTTPTRSLIDFAAVAPYSLSAVTERLLLAGTISRDHIRAAVALHSKQGRRGIGPVRELLRTWPYSNKPSESVLEMRMDRLLSSTNLPSHQTQIEEGPFRIDFGWPEWKIAGEVDGWGKYDMLEQFNKLTDRDAYLQVRGWLVLHFTWRDVTRRPQTVIARLREALYSRGWRPEVVHLGPRLDA